MERDALGLAERKAFHPISIHALRMERDIEAVQDIRDYEISIHALRMERDLGDIGVVIDLIGFQSTRSAWSATLFLILRLAKDRISIHALRMERDV